MKVACERCEKVVNNESPEFKAWRKVVAFKPGNYPKTCIEALLCDRCYDALMDYFFVVVDK